MAVLAAIERDRGDSHGRTNTGGPLSGASWRNASFKVSKYLSKRAANPAMGPDEGSFGRRECQINLSKAVLVHPMMVQQDVAQRQRLLSVV
jgi:hypothetical protein